MIKQLLVESDLPYCNSKPPFSERDFLCISCMVSLLCGCAKPRKNSLDEDFVIDSDYCDIPAFTILGAVVCLSKCFSALTAFVCV